MHTSRMARAAAGIAAAALGLILLVNVVDYRLAQSMFPDSVDPYVDEVFAQAADLVAGRPIYRDPAAWPATEVFYPPLFPALLAGVMTLTGVHLSAAHGLGLALGLAVLVALGTIVRRRTGSTAAGVGAALALAICQRPLSYAIGSPRVDDLSLLLAVLALDGFDRADRSWGAWWTAVLCGVAAPFAKQTAVFALAVGLPILFCRDRRRGLLAAAAAGALAGGAYLAIQVVTDGRFGLYLLGVHSRVPLSLQSLRYVREFLLDTGVISALAAAGIALRLAGADRRRDWRSDPMIWGGLAGCAMAGLNVLQTAGSSRGLYPVALFAALFAAETVVWLMARAGTERPAAALALSAALLVQLAVAVGRPTVPDAADRLNGRAVAEAVRDARGEVWVSRGVSWPLLAGKPVHDDLEVLAVWALAGRLPPAAHERLRARIDAGRFALVVMDLRYGQGLERTGSAAAPLVRDLEDRVQRRYKPVRTLEGGRVTLPLTLFVPR